MYAAEQEWDSNNEASRRAELLEERRFQENEARSLWLEVRRGQGPPFV